MLSLGVLGGTIPRLSQGVEVTQPNGQTGIVIHTPSLSTGAVWVSMRVGGDARGSIQQWRTKQLYPHSDYEGRLGPRTLSLLVPHVQALMNSKDAAIAKGSVGLFSGMPVSIGGLFCSLIGLFIGFF